MLNKVQVSSIESLTESSPVPLGGTLKRTFDLAASALMLVLLAPLLIVVCLVVKLHDRGPIFFAHERIGFAGQRFKCLKFRTMKLNGDVVLAEYLARSPEAAAEWREKRKLATDPRVTAVGQFLRKTSLDEFPQLWNVLKGEMSLIGPRPIVDDEIQHYGKHFASYLACRPGVSGMWQVSGRSDCTYPERVALDARYVSNWTWLLDIGIMLKTVPAVFLQRGSC